MKKVVTIKDMAVKLKIDVSTVSKALNNHPAIGLKTHKRVHKLARDWCYVPNEAARQFQKSKSFTIGLIIPSIQDQFYVQAINGVDKVAEAAKYRIIISQTFECEKKESSILEMLLRDRVDGIIVALTKNTTDLTPFKKLESMGIPVVYFARSPKDLSCITVSSNNLAGACDATTFLINKGHHRIAHLKGPANMQTSDIREAGYLKALTENNIPVNREYIITVDLSKEATYQAMADLLALPHPPTAILTFKNYITLDAIAYLKQEKPEFLGKIDFVGFGKLPMLEYLNHKPVAVIDENSNEIGGQAMQLLLKMMADDFDTSTLEKRNVEVECRLVS